ncbi:MAG: tRNA 5-methoxyuridine(34)/uridine 5-oxyacetic acid(34) synthase CmoB, partial [Candidatus Omnitrophica bacterium]|nr:tRNA 5-methoxyuridine(34)/uridine 5-oxyacetic acid(34) synthase CmoB [Candidatus Omnitrophota bacterium]
MSLPYLFPEFFEKHAEFRQDDFRCFFDSAWDTSKNGHIPMWSAALKNLPRLQTSSFDLNQRAIEIGQGQDADAAQLQLLQDQLRCFIPWRKGPFNYFGIRVDSEWQSWMKWERIQKAVSPLRNRRVLDVGCGNGYYLWRMAGEGASCVFGVEPYILYSMQFLTAQHYLQNKDCVIVPSVLEELPPLSVEFDTVFSMGVLYHVKNPQEHLNRIFALLRDGGEIVLETLVVTDYPDELLIPEGRYAQMRNVSCIPSVQKCEQWLEESGYRDIRLTDLNTTTTEEQRV